MTLSANALADYEKNELIMDSMDSIHFNNYKCRSSLTTLFIALMLPVLAALLKIGDANGAELAFLGGPAVFR